MPLFHNAATVYLMQEALDTATGNILTTSSGAYSDVTGITMTFAAALGDLLLITCSYVVRADSGSSGTATVTVNDNGTLVDVAATTRTSGTAGEQISNTVTAVYEVAHAPSSGATANVTVKLRGKRATGAGNAYVSSPCVLDVVATRGL